MAILVAHITHLYSMYTFIQLFPKYLGDIQGKSIKDIGFLASIPQAMTVVLIIFGSNISDWLYGQEIKNSTDYFAGSKILVKQSRYKTIPVKAEAIAGEISDEV